MLTFLKICFKIFLDTYELARPNLKDAELMSNLEDSDREDLAKQSRGVRKKKQDVEDLNSGRISSVESGVSNSCPPSVPVGLGDVRIENPQHERLKKVCQLMKKLNEKNVK